MSDTFITVIGIMVVAVIMFAVPMMATANQNDAITQSSVEAIIADFVNVAAREGKITDDNYNNLIEKLHATGNTYDVEIEVQVLDDNPGAKGTNKDAIGENISYSVYTNAIMEEINQNGVYKLKEGDYIKTKVNNTNVTIGTSLKNFAYRVMGKDTIVIEATGSALITTTGK